MGLIKPPVQKRKSFSGHEGHLPVSVLGGMIAMCK